MKNKTFGMVSCYNDFNKNDAVFSENAYKIGNDLGYTSRLLRSNLNKNNITIHTLDQKNIHEFSDIIFTDMPDQTNLPNGITLKLIKELGIKTHIILYESELVKPENYEKGNLIYFDNVFTWKSSLADNIKYYKYFWPNKLSAPTFVPKKNKLCVNISGNKKSHLNNELYSKRVEAIRWFEKNALNDFDLYGFGWESELFKKPSTGLLKKALCLIPNLRAKLDPDFFPSYKGQTDDKIGTLQNYKFSICYENATGIDDYVTEKIFDCLIAGTVPIYWGAPNISEIVPENTFIDKRLFKDYQSLYSYIKTMPQETYEKYLSNISRYLKSNDIQKFSAEYFTNTLLKVLIK